MKTTIWLAICVGLLTACVEKEQLKTPTEVASFEGQQVTGVTVSETGKIFANFPRWRNSVKYSVVEVDNSGQSNPYPDSKWNKWNVGQPISDSVFAAVQSVVAAQNHLYVLDTRNPQFKGVINAPRIFVFDLNTNELADILILSENSYHSHSYINDLRIDGNTIYMTDSGAPGLVVYDQNNHKSQRVLDDHVSTRAELNGLIIDGKEWPKSVHSDGIALSPNKERLYFHALTGYSLYSVGTKELRSAKENAIEKSLKLESKTAAPDGMIFDKKGNLYFADLENRKIQYLTPAGHIKTLCEGESIRWADTFSIYDDELYFTNSRIDEAAGDISKMKFTINKVKI